MFDGADFWNVVRENDEVLSMNDLMSAVAAKKAELDRLRARRPDGLTKFEHVRDLELTYRPGGVYCGFATGAGGAWGSGVRPAHVRAAGCDNGRVCHCCGRGDCLVCAWMVLVELTPLPSFDGAGDGDADLFDVAGATFQDFEGGVFSVAPEADVEAAAAEAEVGEGDVGEPVGQGGVDIDLAAGGVLLEAEHGLEEHEGGAGCPGLWDVGAEILDGEIGGVALQAAIELGKLVQQEVAGGAADVAGRRRRLRR